MRGSHAACPARPAPGTVLVAGKAKTTRHSSALGRLSLAEGSLQGNNVHVLRRALGHGGGRESWGDLED